MTLSFAVVCEAAADQRTGCGLADRVFLAEIAWLEQEMLAHCRQWRGLTSSEPHLLWRNVGSLARSRNIRAHGHFQGKPGAPDAHAGRLALLLIHASADPADAVVLLRDDDGQTERRGGLQQARTTSRIGVPIVIGLAHLKRESWVLARFEPQDEAEADCLTSLTKQLGFDPRHHAERLTHRGSGELRSPKRVLAEMTGGDREREAACWRTADLEVLAARGSGTGLAEYLEDVRRELLPLFTRPSGNS